MKIRILIFCCFTALLISCSPKHAPQSAGIDKSNSQSIETWLTDAKDSVFFAKQKNDLQFTSQHKQLPSIGVDANKKFQQIDGFGFCLTDGSAMLLNQMKEPEKTSRLFRLQLTFNCLIITF